MCSTGRCHGIIQHIADTLAAPRLAPALPRGCSVSDRPSYAHPWKEYCQFRGGFSRLPLCQPDVFPLICSEGCWFHVGRHFASFGGVPTCKLIDDQQAERPEVAAIECIGQVLSRSMQLSTAPGYSAGPSLLPATSPGHASGPILTLAVKLFPVSSKLKVSSRQVQHAARYWGKSLSCRAITAV